ncbi:hypothetical protein ACEN2I_04055 [Flavobacterium sp. W22_SRS_FK3]|uniref:hypothetical protein n=1 Tax=Flavobacterium sp. W22_SRS_FK3 TaxID=3240275 RepID=UPI003F8E2C25
MKKLFIVALFFIGAAGFAQDGSQKRQRLTPEQRNEKQLQKLTVDLSLDTNQQTQVKQLLAERSAKAEKFKEARQAKKDSDVKPTMAEKQALRKELMAGKDANDAKMKEILNADQYKKWKTMQDENKERMRERVKEYREENN